jgi:hypothetical protein
MEVHTRKESKDNIIFISQNSSGKNKDRINKIKKYKDYRYVQNARLYIVSRPIIHTVIITLCFQQ